MRYRLMASYRGMSYQAGVGPSISDVTLIAAWPPPEEHGFMSAGSHWRKQVRINDIEALWESRPVGSYHGDPCLVLDDLGDRLHIAYLGMDSARASQLGYWQVDRGVFEVVIPRAEVADLAEERHEFPLRALGAPSARALEAPRVPEPRALEPPRAPEPPRAAAPAPTRAPELPRAPEPPRAPELPWAAEPRAPEPARAAESPWAEPARAPESPWAAGPAGLPRAAEPPRAPEPVHAPEPARAADSARALEPPRAEPPRAEPARASEPPRATETWPPAPHAEAPPAPAGATAWHGSPATEDSGGSWLGYPRSIDNAFNGSNGSNGSNGNGSASEQTSPTGYPVANGYGTANGYGESNGYGGSNGSAAPSDLSPPSWGTPNSDPTDTQTDLSTVSATPAPPLIPLGAPPLTESRSTTDYFGNESRVAEAEPAPANEHARTNGAGQPEGDRPHSSTVVRGRRAARKPRVSAQSVFADLLDQAKIPRSSYAVDEEISGAMCLVKTKSGGFEVFSCADDARHEVRSFEDEEAAYFYLFGVLAAEAIRNGTLSPRLPRRLHA